MSDKEAVERFMAYLTDEKKASGNTLSAYRRDLASFSSYILSEDRDVSSMTCDDIEAYKTYLHGKGLSAASVSRSMSSVRGLYRYLLVSGIVDDDPTRTVKNDKAVKPEFAFLTAKEIEKLLATPDLATFKGIRDKAMLETLYATGMKVTELISLNVSDVNLALGFVTCRAETKQKHDRTVFLYPAAVKAVEKYLSASRRFLADPDNEALFVNLTGSRMTRQGFWKILKGYAGEAGIKKTITPHTLRHSFAVHLLANGADIKDIQAILGHADIASTQVYANFLKSRVKESYLKFHPRA